MSSPPDAPATLISISGLSKAIGGKPIITDLGITLRENEIVGFVGPNGAGKTTTLRLLAGLLQPDVAAGAVCGREVGRSKGANRHVGYMPQKIGLYEDLTVEQNLAFRAEVYRMPRARQAVDAALEVHGLGERRRLRVRELSGGWVRRLQLAAVMLPGPRVLLLDEPTAGLDGRSRRALWRRLVDYARAGAGVIVSTHDFEEAELCDRIILFRAGRMIAEGRTEALVAQAGLEAAVIEGDVDPVELRQMFGPESQVCVSSRGRGARLIAPHGQLAGLVRSLEALGVSVAGDRPRLSDVAMANEEAGVGEAAR